MTAGAGSLVDTVVVPAEDADVQDDSDEDASGMAYGYTNLGVANVEDHLNIRESTDDSSKIVGKMSANAGCEVLEIVGGKAHITSGSVEGYVSMDYLLTGKAALNRAESIVKNLATVTADGLKVRSEASTESEVVGMVAYGEELEVLQEQDGWVKVSYDEESAYVSADYVTVGKKLKTALNMTEFLYGEGVSDVRVELCEYAKQFIGNPYVWGGVSLTKGADCSGFVLSVYQKFGISLPHSSRAQANMGRAISMSEAKPGDLVFYSKGGRINHVAIYIGGGQVCHASSPKTGIKVSGAYYRSPAKVVRILQD
ncbi:MAG: C40 family peptidase [Lachnospiraceae bacterium]|nr:C40 family peptidase [Lachnospiraceae bacterium]